ncbi:dispersed gene family protein 1 (DGF-1), partial [Trypanosoma cruzi]
DGYEHLFYVYRLSVSDHSVFALLNNTMSSGTSLLYQHHRFSVSEHSVLRVVGNSGIVACAIYAEDLWTVQRSSWLDWRDNSVGVGAMFHESEFASFAIDGSSVVTLTGCGMGSTGLSRPLLSQAEAGYGFIAGCLTVAGRVLTTTGELELNGITKVTTVTACGDCTKDGDCFAPLTTAVIDCKCQCAAGGHGEVCVPAPVPAGPPPPPSPLLPPPPPIGECISDMVYPEVAQAVGGGLSWLCYRNVTFSGGGMGLTVLIGGMKGDVANVTFDGCTWRDGAVLLLLGNAYAAVGSLNIVVTGNTFSDALLSPEGGFPPRTNITINGNRFTVTRMIPRLGLDLRRPSCVAMNGLAISNYSAVVLSGNAFQTMTTSSSAIQVVRYALRVTWHSVFAVLGNAFHMAGGEGTPIHLEGYAESLSLFVLNGSAVVVRGNLVSSLVQYVIIFVFFLCGVSVSGCFSGQRHARKLGGFFFKPPFPYLLQLLAAVERQPLPRVPSGCFCCFESHSESPRLHGVRVRQPVYVQQGHAHSVMDILTTQRSHKRSDCGCVQHCERRGGSELRYSVRVQCHHSDLQRPMRPRDVVLPRVHDDGFE